VDSRWHPARLAALSSVAGRPVQLPPPPGQPHRLPPLIPRTRDDRPL